MVLSSLFLNNEVLKRYFASCHNRLIRHCHSDININNFLVSIPNPEYEIFDRYEYP